MARKIEKMKPILVVDDEAIMRESLRDWLTDDGYQVEIAEDGEAALKAIAQQDFGVAIVDLMLPGKNGIEVLREAREKRPLSQGNNYHRLRLGADGGGGDEGGGG